MFIANWFVTEDHASQSGLWVHDNIHIGEACDIVGDVPGGVEGGPGPDRATRALSDS